MFRWQGECVLCLWIHNAPLVHLVQCQIYTCLVYVVLVNSLTSCCDIYSRAHRQAAPRDVCWFNSTSAGVPPKPAMLYRHQSNRQRPPKAGESESFVIRCTRTISHPSGGTSQPAPCQGFNSVRHRGSQEGPVACDRSGPALVRDPAME